MSDSAVDLTRHCPGFPSPAEDEIARDGLIRQIESTFSKRTQCVLLDGAPLTGKTNTLSQFCRWHSAGAISYFVSANPFSQLVPTFLFAVCTQLSVVLGKPLPTDGLSLEDLKYLAQSLSFQLVTRAKRTGTRYFYVVDGLDWALSGPTGGRIVDLLPLLLDAESPYFLASCRSEAISRVPESLTAQRIKALQFTSSETLEFFSKSGLPRETILAVHHKAAGTIGYLEVFKRLAAESPNLPPEIAQLPTELHDLIGRQWNRVRDQSSVPVRQALEYLAASPAPLTAKLMLHLVPELESTDPLIATGIVEQEGDTQQLRFINDLVREAASARTSEKTPAARERLIKALQEVGDGHSDLLSLLYHATGNYAGISSLVVPEKLVAAVGDEVELSRMHHNLTTACEMADRAGDTKSLLQMGFGLSLLKFVFDHGIDDAEVGALLSAGRTQEALRRAYASPDATARIRLLARSYASLKARGEHISVQAREELEHLVNALRLDQIETDFAIQIATELFPVFPDLATSLLERVLKEDDRRGIIDLAMTVAVLADPATADDDLVSRISDPDLAYVARAHSRWLSGLPLSRLTSDIVNVRSTKAKEYLLRRWCRANRTSPELAEAIAVWLDAIIGDSEFVLPLRSLRQVAETVQSLGPDKVAETVSRLDVPRITTLESPLEELVRIHLVLAEAMAALDAGDALSRFRGAQAITRDFALDLDTRVYCLARLLQSAHRLGLDDSTVVTPIRGELERVQGELLDNSADQLAILRGVIGSLVQVDPGDALALVGNINTYERRLSALPRLIAGVLRGPGCADFMPLVDLAMGLIHGKDRDGVIAATMEDLDTDTPAICEEDATLLLARTEAVADHRIASKSLGILVSTCVSQWPEVASDAAASAIARWRQIDDLREKLEIGYELVERIAKCDAGVSKGLLDDVLALKLLPGSPLASGHLGKAQVEAIRLAIRAVDVDILAKGTESLLRLKGLIASLPATEIRLRLLSELAAASYARGYQPYAEALVRDEIIPHLRGLASDPQYSQLLVDCSPVIHEYDPTSIDGLLSELGPADVDRAWSRIAMWALCRPLLTDLIDPEEVKGSASFPRFKLALEAANKISWDSVIYTTLHGIARIAEASFPGQIDQMQAIEVVRRVEDIAASRLPDHDNIKHEGYRIIAIAAAHRLRCHVVAKGKHALGLGKADLRKIWQSIGARAKQLPNAADRAFVLATVAGDMFPYDEEGAAELLHASTDLARTLPSILDRGDRLKHIADTWARCGMKSQARVTIEWAMELAGKVDPSDRRSLVSLLVQSAHRVDAQFAAELTSRLDTRIQGLPLQTAEISLEIEKAVANPSQFRPEVGRPLPMLWVMSSAARRLLKDMVNGRGLIQPEVVMRQWLLASAPLHLAVFRDVSHWVIESLRRAAGSAGLFDRMVDFAMLANRLASAVAPGMGSGVPEPLLPSYPGLATKMHVFRAGERDRAIEWLTNWFSANAMGYLKLCDPYFGPRDITTLRGVSSTCKILVVTTDKGTDLSKGVDSAVAAFRREWTAATSGVMPLIQLIVVPSLHEDIFHDRAVVSSNGGLVLGQSINGIGVKDGKVMELDETDARDLEVNYIDPMLNQASWFTNHGASAIVVPVK